MNTREKMPDIKPRSWVMDKNEAFANSSGENRTHTALPVLFHFLGSEFSRCCYVRYAGTELHTGLSVDGGGGRSC